MNAKGQPIPENALVHRQVLAMHARGATTNEIFRATGVVRQVINEWRRQARERECQS